MQENGLTIRPTQIFNCDESGLPLTHKPPNVVIRVGQKHPYAITSNNNEQITILRLVTVYHKSLNPDWAIGEVPGNVYGLSESGWMDTEFI